MAATSTNAEELVKRLSAHPELLRQMESLLSAVEDETGELKQADAAEIRVIDEMRKMGRQALVAWASGQVDETSREITQCRGVWSEGKKNSAGTPPSATSP